MLTSSNSAQNQFLNKYGALQTREETAILKKYCLRSIDQAWLFKHKNDKNVDIVTTINYHATFRCIVKKRDKIYDAPDQQPGFSNRVIYFELFLNSYIIEI